jgi:hypothetical protein
VSEPKWTDLWGIAPDMTKADPTGELDVERALADLREFADMLATFHRGRKIDADVVIEKLHAALGDPI